MVCTYDRIFFEILLKIGQNLSKQHFGQDYDGMLFNSGCRASKSAILSMPFSSCACLKKVRSECAKVKLVMIVVDAEQNKLR